MKKILPILLLFSIGFYFTPAFSQSNHWMISSEISPLSRSGNERVLSSPSGLNLEWRNRIGFKLTEQTMMGLSTSYRHYNLKEIFYIIPPAPVAYHYEINNQLLGIGAFLTQYYSISPRFHFQTSAYMQIEQGKGTYQNTHPGNIGSSGGTRGEQMYSSGIKVGVLEPPRVIESSTYRERNFFGGIEFGASYFITEKWILQTNINLLQFENFRNALVDIKTPPTEITRPVEQEGSGITFLTDRPIMSVGVMVLLGKK